jgi:hypothetical protein
VLRLQVWVLSENLVDRLPAATICTTMPTEIRSITDLNTLLDNVATAAPLTT